MDSHSKNVCLIGILHIVSCFLQIIELIFPYNVKVNDDISSKNHPDLLLPMGYYVVLAAAASLMIGGVINKRHTFLLPFLVISSLALAKVTLPFLTFIGQGNFDNYGDIDRIGFGIMSVYPTYTLFLDLHSQPSEAKMAEVQVASVEQEKKIFDV